MTIHGMESGRLQGENKEGRSLDGIGIRKGRGHGDYRIRDKDVENHTLQVDGPGQGRREVGKRQSRDEGRALRFNLY